MHSMRCLPKRQFSRSNTDLTRHDSDDLAFAPNPMPPSLNRFPSGYDDHFTEMVASFDPAPPEQQGYHQWPRNRGRCVGQICKDIELPLVHLTLA